MHIRLKVLAQLHGIHRYSLLFEYLRYLESGSYRISPSFPPAPTSEHYTYTTVFLGIIRKYCSSYYDQ